MTITKYEIDMLNVGAADAFLIHFFDDDNNYPKIRKQSQWQSQLQ